MRNARGSELDVIDHGATITALRLRRDAGHVVNVVLGHDTLPPYLAGAGYLGAMVGRVANRIAESRYRLDGRTVELDRNAGRHHLHGGSRGFNRLPWRAGWIDDATRRGVQLRLTSPDGDMGHPGTLEVTVTYRLTDRDELVVEWDAATDAPTHVNLTQHAYFNLAGCGTVLEHELRIEADRYTPCDADGIPTGERRPVAGSPLDFRRATAIGERIGAVPGGYDHNFVLAEVARSDPMPAATLRDPSSGITLRVATTEPGLQLWTDNIAGAVGPGRHAGVCLETQHFPDAPNQPTFPDTLLRPGARRRSRTVYAFSAGMSDTA